MNGDRWQSIEWTFRSDYWVSDDLNILTHSHEPNIQFVELTTCTFLFSWNYALDFLSNRSIFNLVSSVQACLYRLHTAFKFQRIFITFINLPVWCVMSTYIRHSRRHVRCCVRNQTKHCLPPNNKWKCNRAMSCVRWSAKFMFTLADSSPHRTDWPYELFTST